MNDDGFRFTATARESVAQFVTIVGRGHLVAVQKMIDESQLGDAVEDDPLGDEDIRQLGDLVRLTRRARPRRRCPPRRRVTSRDLESLLQEGHLAAEVVELC